MAKRPNPGKCVHCLKHPVERNWDHVFPKSWYPDTSAPNIYKWQIPSCISCNSALGAVESDFLRSVALCLAPDDPASSSVVKKALRSMNPAAAKTEKDRKIRASLRQRMLDEAQNGATIPQTGLYPSLGEKWGRPREEQVAIRIPNDSFRRLTEKVVRGIFYVEDEKFIEPPFAVTFYALGDDRAEPIRKMLDQFGQTYAREPGIVVRRVVAPEDGISSIFEIEFWGQFKAHACVTRPDS